MATARPHWKYKRDQCSLMGLTGFWRLSVKAPLNRHRAFSCTVAVKCSDTPFHSFWSRSKRFFFLFVFFFTLNEIICTNSLFILFCYRVTQMRRRRLGKPAEKLWTSLVSMPGSSSPTASGSSGGNWETTWRNWIAKVQTSPSHTLKFLFGTILYWCKEAFSQTTECKVMLEMLRFRE